ncbi:Receptor-type guanylate cyclase gcy [Seminavis robusta]|uniref:Receptor-type guanylate cyclase gcy n=1 Tax=Seminavis robusta TaxID=568900 RepID=A0A9N8D7M4_9STRA|nr:Receptor-type guanylate cyclase gcy [Seminavis robusta]|eukprot:Sro8_g006540.1 Receptor-type guanylate cyclase gcy (1199) ;mRNA; f:37963-43203
MTMALANGSDSGEDDSGYRNHHRRNHHEVVEEYHDELSLSEDSSDGDIHGSSQSGSSTATTSKKITEETNEKLAQRETRHVLYLRLLVCAILLAAALAVSLMVYNISIQAEEDQFQLQFLGAASKVTDTFLEIANDRLGYAGALVVSLVSHAIDREGAWPFVTLSNFPQRAQSVKEQSGILSIGVNPIVERRERRDWENYTLHHPEAVKYYNDSMEYNQRVGLDELDNRRPVQTDDEDLDIQSSGIANRIYDLARFQGSKAKISPGKDRYLPAWLLSPFTSSRAMINQDRSSNSEGLRLCLLHDAVVFEGLQFARPGYGFDEDPYTSEIAWLLSIANKEPTLYLGDLFSTVYLPLYDSFKENRRTVGIMRLVFHWARFFRDILPPSQNGILFVLEDTCSEPFTYVINGGTVEPLGVGDLHDPKYDFLEQRADFRNVSRISDGTAVGMALYQDSCPITIRVYPTKEFHDSFRTNNPAIITVAVACVFVFAMLMFFVYDRLVERRQRLVLKKAEQTSAIVSSLFPKNVRDRMMEETNKTRKKEEARSMFSNPNHHNNPRQSLVSNRSNSLNGRNGAPIADLFPEATVMFADIAGFTAWSSSRDPAQVFLLLQNIYQAFDRLAAKRQVFKVETIGDSYVAVTGCPTPQPRHALIMARFAAECMGAMRSVVQSLYTELGPDTADLTMRFGINSGPVTAGVLMGDRARFQLFGDTVNTAARMESTGVKDKIQASKSTADILTEYGKQHWLQMREDKVHAKGKGLLTTYFVSPWAHKEGTTVTSSDSGQYDPDALAQTSGHTPSPEEPVPEMAYGRLVEWMTELFKSYVKDIVAKRAVTPKKSARSDSKKIAGGTPLDEVVEIIELPQFDPKALEALARSGRSVVLDDEITSLLREYVAVIASLYHNNPFHNFDHACHVTMAANKFLKRVVKPGEGTFEGAHDAREMASQLHDYTHGIHSDPITLFAIVFSALIHDVDHMGVSNAQLEKENEDLAILYKHKSIAEQNSLDVAWDHLMSDKFEKLRNYIFATPSDLARFREVVVNVVLATDIFDKELNDLRKTRWNKAFSEDSESSLSKVQKNGLRATIVIEHIMQASDVSHTMQHWHVYRKWNKNLFQEMTLAHREGRMSKDPATFWYQGELGFFDNYIIPLAKKLKECNVFGVTSDECLNYAMQNREEWEERGQSIVAEMVEELRRSGTEPAP